MSSKELLPGTAAHSEAYVKDFFDMAVPSTIKFYTDYFICGDSYRSVWAIKEPRIRQSSPVSVTKKLLRSTCIHVTLTVWTKTA